MWVYGMWAWHVGVACRCGLWAWHAGVACGHGIWSVVTESHSTSSKNKFSVAIAATLLPILCCVAIFCIGVICVSSVDACFVASTCSQLFSNWQWRSMFLNLESAFSAQVHETEIELGIIM